MSEEFIKNNKKLRFSLKLNKRTEKDLKRASDRVDKLEMENYLLMDQIADLSKLFDESKQTIADILKILDRDSIG